MLYKLAKKHTKHRMNHAIYTKCQMRNAKTQMKLYFFCACISFPECVLGACELGARPAHDERAKALS